MRKIIQTTLVLFTIFWSQVAFSWGDAGHKLVALIAYEQLAPEVRAKVIAAIKTHPRFKKDFKLPGFLSNADEEDKDRWIFAQAAIWPDIARSIKPSSQKRKYHSWNRHFVNLPMYLTEEDSLAYGGKVPANLNMEWTEGMKRSAMNGVQAYKKAVNRVQNEKNAGLYLAWIFHLVGDIHQPLHSTAVFSKTKLEKGDEGGNELVFDVGFFKTVHSWWDGLPGHWKTKFDKLKEMTKAFLADSDHTEAGSKASEDLSFERWTQESHNLARRTAYTPRLLNEIKTKKMQEVKMFDDVELKYVIDLGDEFDEYGKVCKKVADRRIVEAGYRLAGLMNQMYGTR